MCVFLLIVVLHWICQSRIVVLRQDFHLNVISLRTLSICELSWVDHKIWRWKVLASERGRRRDYDTRKFLCEFKTLKTLSKVKLWSDERMNCMSQAHACTQFTSHKMYMELLLERWGAETRISLVISLKMDSTTLKLDPKWKTNNEIWRKKRTDNDRMQCFIHNVL